MSICLYILYHNICPVVSALRKTNANIRDVERNEGEGRNVVVGRNVLPQRAIAKERSMVDEGRTALARKTNANADRIIEGRNVVVGQNARTGARIRTRFKTASVI